MKRLVWILCVLATLLVCAALFACTDAPAGDSETPDAPTSPAAHPDTAAPTEAPTAAPTEMPTEAPTEAPTEPETDEPNVIKTAKLTDDSGIFRRVLHCKGSVEQDAAAGGVIRLTSSKISAPGAAVPEAYLSLDGLAKAAGVPLPETGEFPYLVLKVRTGGVWSRLFSLHGGLSLKDAKPADMRAMQRVYMADTEDWQYIGFDLSAVEGNVESLYIQFEYGAGANGEYVDIAELRFLATEAEAAALCGKNVYEVEAPDDELTVISYNIWVGGGTDTTMRADILRDVIDRYRPDSIGMQEVTLAWLAAFEDFAFNDSYAGVGEGRSDSYEACLIYYRTDKYELVDSGTFWLSDTPDVKGSSYAEALYPRICTWVHLRDRVTGFEYVHVNTHLDHLGGGKGGNELRGKQAEVLLEFVRQLGDMPMVMTGDFNTTPSDGKGSLHPAYAYITGYESFEAADGTAVKGAFMDARVNAETTVPADKTATMTKYYEEGGNSSYPPIDYQFYIPTYFAPLSYETFIFERDGVPISDHLALICRYRILEKE